MSAIAAIIELRRRRETLLTAAQNLINSLAPAPDDAAVKWWIDEGRLEKYGT